MTKSELAAQKCQESAPGAHWKKSHFLNPENTLANAYREFREHVSDLCEHAINSGDTSGLEELVLREAVDPLESEAEKFAESWAPEMVTPSPEIRLVNLKMLALAALRRGREIELGEGK